MQRSNQGLLESAEPASRPATAIDGATADVNQLVQARLGFASSLYIALRARHAPTAAHCLRVALDCSAWASRSMGASLPPLNDAARDELEVAALLHDVGKIGAPDTRLFDLNPPSEAGSRSKAGHSVRRHFEIGCDILAGCGASASLLDILRCIPAPYRRHESGTDAACERAGDELPLAARMISIVDAFDRLTHDRDGRPALTAEQAINELWDDTDPRFDPRLVKDFRPLVSQDPTGPRRNAARRWLEELCPSRSNRVWSNGAGANGAGANKTGENGAGEHGAGRASGLPVDAEPAGVDIAFYHKLLEGLNDGVVFVDAKMHILLWSPATERLTGISAASVRNQAWTPQLVDLRNERGIPISSKQCPLRAAVRTGTSGRHRLSLSGVNGKTLSVDARLVPVSRRDGTARGATLVLHDTSSRVTLEERVHALHERATRDPLTQIANRAEFDRVLKQFIDTHLEHAQPCSLIICDLDFFKRINDTYGHQAGDEALVSFAALLRRSCRPADLVARYGGEEFVVLCADCDNGSATERAEEICRDLADIPQASLDGECLTASFGVTEIQEGDSPETMVRRADRALSQAKETGRNRVVRLGAGIGSTGEIEHQAGWFPWWRQAQPDRLVERQLVTAVPLKVAVEKLRGFVADHHAEIISIDEQTILLQISAQHTPLLRRTGDRPVPYQIELTFSESRDGQGECQHARTLVNVTVRPKRNRDRRRADVLERARKLVRSLKAYLMAQDLLAPR